MAHSNVVTGSLTVLDLVAPGDPALALSQPGPNVIEARVTLPSTDADGNPLTGLAGAVVALLAAGDGGANPFVGVAGADLKSFTLAAGGPVWDVGPLTVDDAGTVQVVRFENLTLNTTYYVGVTVFD